MIIASMWELPIGKTIKPLEYTGAKLQVTPGVFYNNPMFIIRAATRDEYIADACAAHGEHIKSYLMPPWHARYYYQIHTD